MNPGLDQGIYYQIDGDNTLSIEFIETVSGDTTGTLFHWIAQYKTTSPGLFDIYYFSDGDTGTDATVGIQGDDNDGSKYQLVCTSLQYKALCFWRLKSTILSLPFSYFVPLSCQILN